MNVGMTSVAAVGALKSPTKAMAPPVPSLTLAGVQELPTPARQFEASNSTPDLPLKETKVSLSVETSSSTKLCSTTTSSGVPTIVEGVVSSSSPSFDTKSGVGKPSATAAVSLAAADGTSATSSRTVGPTPLPRTKRGGPSKRGGTQLESKATQRMNFSQTSRKEATDVQEMEQGLLHLLDDFHSGRLQPFVKDCSFEKMDNVREQQERLARLHFDLGSQQEAYGTMSEEGQLLAKDHLAKLMTQLQELSTAIEQLQSSTSSNEDHQETHKR